MSITMPGRRPCLWGFRGISFDVKVFLLVEDLDDGQNRQNPDVLGFFLGLSSLLTNLCCFFFLFSAMSANGFGYGSAGGL